jgi:hypothetical protein
MPFLTRRLEAGSTIEIMLQRRPVLVLAAAVVVGGAVAGVVLASHGGGGERARTASEKPRKPQRAPEKKTYAQLVAENYKVLKPQQSTRLLHYAEAAYACMSKDLELRKPRLSATRIVMALPAGTTASETIQSMGRCAAKIGDPPLGSTFLVRGHNVIVYLPKYCILDKKTLARTPAPPPP